MAVDTLVNVCNPSSQDIGRRVLSSRPTWAASQDTTSKNETTEATCCTVASLVLGREWAMRNEQRAYVLEDTTELCVPHRAYVSHGMMGRILR